MQRVLLNKYFIDEFYNAVVVRPVIWVSRNVLWRFVDDGVIDGGGVNGWARITRLLGWVGTRLQTGQVTTYIVLFVLGALVLFRAMTQ